MKLRPVFVLVLGLILAPVALAASGTVAVTYARATTYADGSSLPVSEIASHVITCTFTAPAAAAVPCTGLSPAFFAGSATSGSLVLSYPATGGKVCVQLATVATNGATSAISATSAASCKDFVPLAPGAPTNVTITISVSVSP